MKKKPVKQEGRAFKARWDVPREGILGYDF
jgi:hypothetical protein